MKEFRSVVFAGLFLGLAAVACCQTKPAAKNVVLFIGDGMGMAQVQVAAAQAFGMSKNGEEPGEFSFEKFPVYGYLNTSSANSYVTDSAAAGTAYSTGHKTDNGMIATGPKGRALDSIADIARNKGKAVGVVSSVAFNHATPAVFFATQGKRADYDEITSQVFAPDAPDVVMGGGIYAKTWTPTLLGQTAEKNNIALFTCQNFADLTLEKVGNRKVLGILDNNNNQMLDAEASRTAECTEPHLSQVAAKAAELLMRDQDGFFLMVEGGAIDWACHGNNLPEMAGEVIEFDRTVSAVADLLQKSGKLDETLIIVTADHETGGLTIPGPYKKKLSKGTLPQAIWSTKGHTAIPVPVWAKGPGAEALMGKSDNTAVFNVMNAQMQ